MTRRVIPNVHYVYIGNNVNVVQWRGPGARTLPTSMTFGRDIDSIVPFFVVVDGVEGRGQGTIPSLVSVSGAGARVAGNARGQGPGAQPLIR